MPWRRQRWNGGDRHGVPAGTLLANMADGWRGRLMRRGRGMGRPAGSRERGGGVVIRWWTSLRGRVRRSWTSPRGRFRWSWTSPRGRVRRSWTSPRGRFRRRWRRWRTGRGLGRQERGMSGRLPSPRGRFRWRRRVPRFACAGSVGRPGVAFRRRARASTSPRARGSFLPGVGAWPGSGKSPELVAVVAKCALVTELVGAGTFRVCVGVVVAGLSMPASATTFHVKPGAPKRGSGRRGHDL